MLDIINLDNGLKIYLVNDNTKHSTYINLIVKFGGIDSSIYFDKKKINIKSGTAHFLEHLVLECNDYGDLMTYFGNNGVGINGITSLNKTHFYIDTVSKDIDNYLKIFLCGIHSPIISKANINKIKGPILAEKRRSLDKKYNSLYNLSIRNVLKSGKFKSILGDIKDINSININDLSNAFDIFYRPSNEIIVIGGRFNKNKVINTIKEIYSNIDFCNKSIRNINYKNIYNINKKYSIIKDDVNIEKSVISFKISLNNLESFERVKLDNYLYYFLRNNFGITSKLNQSLKKNNIIIGNIGFDSVILDNSIIIKIDSYVKDMDLFNRSVVDFLINKRYVFDEELFNIYKKNSVIDYVTRKDSIYSTIDPLIDNIISFNYERLDDIEDIDKLSFKEYKKTISSIDFSTYSIVSIKMK